MSSFPGALASFAGFTSSHTLAADNHAAQHNLEQGEILAVQTKVGTGSSTPTSGTILRGTGAGTSSWAQVALTTDVTGTLPVANGGTGATSLTGLTLPSATLANPAISGTVSGGATYSTPTLTTPIIADFSSATHTHASNTQGGQLTGSTALVNSTVTANKLATGAQAALISTNESTASTSYTDLATVGPSVTVTIGANGLALLTITVQQSDSAGTAVTYTSYVASGANTIAASDNNALVFVSPANNNALQATYSVLLDSLTPGTTTFTLQYRCNGSTGSWLNRRLSVIPL